MYVKKESGQLYIVCERSPLSFMPIRALIDCVQYEPSSDREQFGASILCPFDFTITPETKGISLMGRTRSVQFLGFVSTWRAYCRFRDIAPGLKRALKNRTVIFYHGELLDEGSRVFLELFSAYCNPGQIKIIYGEPESLELFSLQSVSSDTENEIVALLATSDPLITDDQRAFLFEMGDKAIENTNYWSALALFKKLFNGLSCSEISARIAFRLGMIYRFLEQTERAESYYLRAQKSPDYRMRVRAGYALGVLYGRHHPSHLQSSKQAKFFVDQAYDLLQEKTGRNYTEKQDLFLFLLNRAACALVHFKEGDIDRSYNLVIEGLDQLHAMPPSDERDFYISHAEANTAQIARKRGDLEQARDINKTLAERDPYFSLWWVEYIRALIDLKQLDRAEEILKKARDIHPNSLELFVCLGDLYKAQKRPEEKVLEQYRHAWKYGVKTCKYTILYAQALSEYGHYEEALRILNIFDAALLSDRRSLESIEKLRLLLESFVSVEE